MAETDIASLLVRIADTLDRMAPPADGMTDPDAFPAYGWDGKALTGHDVIAAPPLSLLRGVERQRDIVAENTARLARGAEAHDMLLWGARGMGKSALVRSSVAAASDQGDIALVQAASDALHTLPTLFAVLKGRERHFLVFIDDIGFEREDEARALRSLLEGGVTPRPANVRIAVTSNRRTIVSRTQEQQDDPVNARDDMDDALALADRFGLSVGFHKCDQDDYLAIVAGYADHYGLEWDRGEALTWSRQRGARSGRVARHYIAELAGRAGRSLD
ncbi:ATP-binding protein [Croceicoccus mobilis]|uniref:ATPase AAA n=1 Tax=Croceicoccus mobilis TaxID=1703339 RepID=A0A917DQN4_9SPHN|nr:ATP-binding protein [Croceicoccus mobilis]GGD60006.1 ATPase AAA [Croceicoccus mobilis]